MENIEVLEVSGSQWEELLRAERSHSHPAPLNLLKPNQITAPTNAKLPTTKAEAADAGAAGGSVSTTVATVTAAASDDAPQQRKRRLPPSLGGDNVKGVENTSMQPQPQQQQQKSKSGGGANSNMLADLTYPGEIVVAETPEEIDVMVSRIRSALCDAGGAPRVGVVLGWDLEWVVTFRQGLTTSLKRK